MSGHWLGANRSAFVRDLLRDYCEVCAALAEQDRRFAATGTISHAVLRELLGKDMRKGVFWRLKDTAHHLFRTPRSRRSGGPEGDAGFSLWQFSSGKAPDGMVRQGAVDALLDWCVGYAFHECVKLKEDAFQRQHYANRLVQMRGRLGSCEDTLTRLEPLMAQTRESIGRELARILHVLEHTRGLLILYLREHGGNGHVARFLLAREALARAVFAGDYPALLQALYGDRPEKLRLLAARAYLEGGRPQQALEVLDALDAPPDDETRELRRMAESFDMARPQQGSTD